MMENNIFSTIETLSDLIQSSMSGRKQAYAVTLLNKIIDKLNYQEKYIELKKANKIGVNKDNYEYFAESAVNILIAMGFQQTDIFEANKEAIDFIIKHKHKFKQPMTAEYLNSMQLLYKYHCEFLEKKPETLKDLNNAYTEIKDIRGAEL